MKKELNDKFLRSLKPEEDRLEYSDTKCPGLRFRLAPSGRATWIYEKRIRGGRKRKFPLGTWPKPTSLADARKAAFEILAEANAGIDRVELAEQQRQQQEIEVANRVTVQQALDAYDELHLATIRTGSERKRQLAAALSKHLELPIGSLKKQHLQQAVDDKSREGRKPYANRIRAALVAFANWCFVRGYIEEPIATGIAKATRERSRDRVMSLGEVRQVWSATYEMGELWGPYFRLAILTGQRRGEISRLRWSEVSLVERTIVKPGSETKNGKPHITHLSEAALKELKRLADGGNQQEFVFTFDGKRPVSNASHAKARLDKLLEDIEPWRIHDLRTAMASALAGAGVPEGVVDRIQNHSASGSAPSAVSRVYQQHDLLPQRAAALDRWAEMVLGTEGKVIEMTTASNRRQP